METDSLFSLRPTSIRVGANPVRLPSASIVLPGLVLLVAFVIPLVLLLRASFAPSDAPQLWVGFTLDQYHALGASVVIRATWNAVYLAIVVSFAALVIAYPLAWLLAQMGRRAQTLWLILILTTLSLSDVLVTFSWQVLLSRNLWLYRMLRAAGMTGASASLVPSFGAAVCCVLYVAIPFSVMILYPALSRLDRQWVEAARTMGAKPWRVFVSVVIPCTSSAIGITLILDCMLTFGAYVMPLVLGRPRDWTLAVLISDAALNTDNLPGAAALSVLMLAVTGALAVVVWKLTRARRLA
ncbi:ABC transporter permease [Paraburkholderia sp. XV]|uniref:ABC transporter permease n=1 Tax=Paraburkholderia sp. XV TaxID=2831520 RepID=UPI001CD282A5|nr:ABC transporter permease [Paraburkholderia sp. XV]